MFMRTLILSLSLLAAGTASAANSQVGVSEELVVYGRAIPAPSVALREQMDRFVQTLERGLETQRKTDLALLPAPLIRVAEARLQTRG
jgi:hypothetical protein